MKMVATHIVCCWKCRNHGNGVTLIRIRDYYGKKKKTADYICTNCRNLGYYEPPIGNTSRIKIEYKEKNESR